MWGNCHPDLILCAELNTLLWEPWEKCEEEDMKHCQINISVRRKGDYGRKKLKIT